MSAPGRVRPCLPQDGAAIYHIINDAASAYKGHIPADCYHEPYMPLDELREEMQRIRFVGWDEGGQLLGVMGLEPVQDTTLIRHAYVLSAHQRRGIGSRLLARLVGLTATPWLLVGTWADAPWAVTFYRKHGFSLLSNKDELLLQYWVIPQRQRETSVVLGLKLKGER